MRKTSDCPWCDCSDAARRQLRVEGRCYNSFLRHCEPAERRKNYSPVEKAGLPVGQCDLGWHRVCGSGALLVRALLACQDGAAIAS